MYYICVMGHLANQYWPTPSKLWSLMGCQTCMCCVALETCRVVQQSFMLTKLILLALSRLRQIVQHDVTYLWLTNAKYLNVSKLCVTFHVTSNVQHYKVILRHMNGHFAFRLRHMYGLAFFQYVYHSSEPNLDFTRRSTMTQLCILYLSIAAPISITVPILSQYDHI